MELDAATLATYMPILKDSVVVLASAITVGIAIYGLRVWKRDLVGKEVYEAVKELVYQSHSISLAAARCIYPIAASEARVFTDEERTHTTANERIFLSESSAYRKRHEAYLASFQNFSDSLLRARVLLGSKVSKAYQPYEIALIKPITLINDYLSVIEDWSDYPYPESPEVIRLRALFVDLQKENEIVRSIYEAREKAETFSLPYLHRKSIK